MKLRISMPWRRPQPPTQVDEALRRAETLADRLSNVVLELEHHLDLEGTGH